MKPDATSTGTATVKRLEVYLLAGVRTAPDFMRELQAQLRTQLSADGAEVALHAVYPYGDWHRSVLLQLGELGMDWAAFSTERKPGVRRAAALIRQAHRGGQMVIVGHSGGGLSGYYAAEQLAAEGYPLRAVIQIGAPRHRIAAAFRDKVCHLYMPRDVVARLGLWGGWERDGRLVPRWRPGKDAPGVVTGLALIGTHADYFRSGPLYRDADGISNLDKTMRHIIDFVGNRQ